MAFCKKCGVKLDEDAKFCPACGEKAEAEQKQSDQIDLSEKFAEFNNTPDSTAEFDKADIEGNKVMGVLAYLSWLVLIPIFAAPKSKFARYHANQGLVLAIVEIAWAIITKIVSTILYSVSLSLGMLSSLLGLVNILFLVLAIIGIVNAATGKAKELPLIGKIKILK